MHTHLQTAFARGQVGWLVSERLINMPVQVVPPMYNMLMNEIQWALDEVWKFSLFVLLDSSQQERTLPI